MKRRVVLLLIVAVLLTLIVLTLAIIKRYNDMHLMDGDGMVNEIIVDAVSFSSSGGMRGGHTYINAVRGEDNSITVSVRFKAFWDADEEQREYLAKAELFDEIERIVAESSFWYAADRPKSEIFALDAPSEELKIRLSSGEYIRVNDRQELSKKENDAWYRIIELLKDESYKAG